VAVVGERGVERTGGDDIKVVGGEWKAPKAFDGDMAVIGWATGGVFFALCAALSAAFGSIGFGAGGLFVASLGCAERDGINLCSWVIVSAVPSPVGYE
jgi:hypothetical protein